MFNLAGVPSGTLLTHAQHIRAPIIPNNKWIVWLNKEKILYFDEEYNNLSKMKGIKSIKELDEIKISIYDTEWKWEDMYINNIVANYV